MKFPLLLLTVASIAYAATCDSLAGLKLPNVIVDIAETRPAGELNLAGQQPLGKVPEFCRVAGSILPSADSDIRFEVWLPLAASWNNKFQGVGNGGYAGNISFGSLADAVSHGYATAGTDTGHKALPNNSAAWALGHPEKITDFAYRAIHETAVTAKAVIRAFYGEAPKKSYFNACSTGGRQGLMEAQRFPADYDGILAGAPANYWTHLMASASEGSKATLSEPASYIPAAKLPAIEAAAIAQCDALDGVKDGVIENPAACRFDPSVLLCKGNEANSCLTTHQLAALKTIYAGLTDSKGKSLFPGLSPGGEAEPGGWAQWITGSAPQKSSLFSFGTEFYKNFVYSDPAWKFQSFDADRDTKAADDRLGQVINAVNPDLSAFFARGGKLILYHGWSDAAIPAMNTIQYYESVVKKLGTNSVRLFMVPGMQHCAGGAGPNEFGQGGTPDTFGKPDRFHSADAALEAWVEQGFAPERLIASKREANNRANPVTRTRPLCPWPQIAKYKGTGDTNDESNFTCSKP